MLSYYGDPGADYHICEEFDAVDDLVEALDAAVKAGDARAVQTRIEEAQAVIEGPEACRCEWYAEAVKALDKAIDRACTWQCDVWPMSDVNYLDGEEGAETPPIIPLVWPVAAPALAMAA